MFTQYNDIGENQEEQEAQKEEEEDVSIVGTKSLSDPENLDIQRVAMEVTHRNNVYDRSSPIKDRVPKSKELSTDELLYVMDKLSDAGVESFTFTGGEATKREDFRTIVQYAVNKFEHVAVHTNGTTDRNIHEHDVTTIIDLDYPLPIDHNSIHRMTNPEEYRYSTKKGPVKVRQKTEEGEIVEKKVEAPRLIAKKLNKSKFTGETFQTHRKATIHVANGHKTEAVEQFNKEHGTDYKKWKEIKEDDQFSWELFLEREEPKLLENYERQQQLALEKVINMPEDTPVIIQSKILSNNNLFQLIAIASEIDAQIVFKPVYPVKENEISHQMPKPKRFKEAVTDLHKLDYQLKTSIRIDHPIYKLYNVEKHMEDTTAQVNSNQLREWLKRGRVSDVGVNKIHIAPNGEVMPSKHIRHKQYRLGNIIEDSVEDIRESMAEFNQEISSSKDLKPVGEQFDLRERHIAADPNIYLNKSYSMPKNNTIKSKPEQINN